MQVTRQNRFIILSDNSFHSSRRPFRVTAGSVSLAAVPFCLESGSTRFGLMCCS